MSEKEFDLDFDFEKEYGITLPPEDGELPIDEEFDLDAILAEDFGSDADDLPGKYAPDFDYGLKKKIDSFMEQDLTSLSL